MNMRNLKQTIFGSVAIATATLLSACSDEAVISESPSNNITGVTISAPDFIPDGDLLTRTEVNITQLGAEFLWQADDLVGIYPDKGTQVRFPMENGAGSSTAKFDGGGWAVKGAYSYMAYYPFIPDMNMDKTAIPADYSGQRQHGSNNHDHIGHYDYMTATHKTPTEDGTVGFDFLHMGALVRLTLPVTKADTYEVLTIHTDGEIPLRGTFDITQDNISLNITETTHDFTIALDEINTVDEGEEIIIFFMLPPVNLLAFDTYAILRSDKTEIKYLLEPKNYEAGKIYAPTASKVASREAALLSPGNKFNSILKSLANNNTYYATNPDEKVKHIIFKTNSDFTPVGDMSNVKEVQEPFYDPIYAVWDAEQGIMTIHTIKDILYCNENASDMFRGFEELEDIDFSEFCTSATSGFARMFQNCYKLKNIDLSHFDFSNTDNLSEMFSNCRSITSLDFSDRHDLANITGLVYTWEGCRNLTSIDLSMFTADGISARGALKDCYSLTTVKANDFHFDENWEGAIEVFWGCKALRTIDLSQFDFRQATDLNGFFNNCEALENITFGSSFTTQNVTSMSGMFNGCKSLSNIDLSKFDTRNVESMYGMFSGCTNLESIDLSTFNTENVRTMNGMFSGDTKLREIDLSTFTNPHLEDLEMTFRYCTNLETVIFGIDFKTTMCVNFRGLFEGCNSLKTIDLSMFDTNLAKDLSYMFFACQSLETIDLKNFKTRHVESIERMFEDCQQLKKLDISNFEAGEYLSLNTEFSTGAPGFGCEEINYGAKWDFDELLVPYDESQTAEDVSYKKITCLPSFMQRLINHAPVLQECKDNGTLTFINAETGETM